MAQRLGTLACCVLPGILAAGLLGCGRKEPPAPPPAPGPRATPAQAPAAPGAAPQVAGAPARGRPAGPDQDSSAAWNDPSVDPSDLFLIATAEGNFEIVGRETAVRDSDRFAVVLPPPGGDSSHVSIVEPARRPSGAPHPDFRLPAGFTPLPEAGYSEEGLPWRIRGEKDNAVMALVPAGVARIGTDEGQPEASPSIVVFVGTYYIDVTEVTVERFERFREARREERRSVPSEPLNAAGPGNHPVLGVTAADAQAYARWAGKELPTEAEWEKAARGPDGFRHPWGEGRAVWSRARTPEQIDPVGSFRTDRSPYGVLDMAGNAREWCLDWYSDRAFAEAAAASPGVLRDWSGPRRPSVPDHRVVKGNGPAWEAWHRSGAPGRERRPDIGFRCVLRVASPE